MPRAEGGNRLRIIGGRWRGRRLQFPAVAGLRPTPDRVRQTLFDWLAPVIEGARCLDLFAGSGALGIEALSRGAAEVVFVERNPVAARALRENLVRLEVVAARVVQAEALTWLQGPAERFDVVLLDPPFASALMAPACRLLDQAWLAPAARIYLETARGLPPPLPERWRIVREKTAGRVCYRLALRQDDS